jgi:hypothetical protein
MRIRLCSQVELNEAISELRGDPNSRLMRKLGASRREFLDTIDRLVLLALPNEPNADAGDTSVLIHSLPAHALNMTSPASPISCSMALRAACPSPERRALTIVAW